MINKGKQITDMNLIKKMEIEILDEIVSFCEQHDLKYILAYGTLLGAVRHKGFIPWDDDIDILMPRDDYQKFIKLYKNNQDYTLLECTRDDSYLYAFAKLYNAHTFMEEYDIDVRCDLGLYVDIFPYDGIEGTPQNSSKFLKHCETLEKKRLYAMLSKDKFMHSNPLLNIGRSTYWKYLHNKGASYFAKKLNELSQTYTLKNTTWAGCLCTRKSEEQMLPIDVFTETTKMLFEGKEYCVPVNYDLMLKTQYGDYMKFPPVEERVYKHNFKLWECKR